jgi:hypothetical protein
VFVHSVYFWLKNNLSEEDRATFLRGLDALTKIETVRQAHVGVPAGTDRPVIERTYSYALVLGFDDEAGHDVYQEHPVHDRFRGECSPFWTRVLIFDSTSV